MKRLASLFMALAVILGFPAWAAPQPLHVVTSFSILADMAQTIGGDAVNVTALVGSNQDAHSYQPTPEDAETLAKADLIIVNGLGFEGWMDRLIKASGTHAHVIIASRGVTPLPSSPHDPHAWQDLANGRIYARNIAAALEQASPASSAAIAERAARYDAALVKTDQFVRKQFADIPMPGRKVMTSHDAFSYFGAAYGIRFLAVEGTNGEAEPSASDLAKLIDQIKSEGIRQIFLENMTNPALIRQIGKDTGAVMGGTLYADALSAPDGPAPTYLAMFTSNVPKLRAAMLQNKL